MKKEQLKTSSKKRATSSERIEAKLLKASRIGAVSAIAASFAHQIKNPLQIIRFNAEILHRKIQRANTNVQDNYLKNILKIEHSIDKINDLIDHVSRLLKDGTQEKTWINLEAVIESAFHLFKDQLSSRRIKAVIQQDKGKTMVHGDFTLLEQVFINLIVNARDALTNCKNPQIQVQICNDNSKVEITFSDNGVGIPEHLLEAVFESLFTTKEHGTGLGLWLCKTVIEQMKGKINIDSKEGLGTIFKIILPTKNDNDNK